MGNKNDVKLQEWLTAVFEDETINNNEIYFAEIDLLESYLLAELTELFLTEAN